MTNDNDIVVFEDADGNEISNDPRWHARKVLEAAGMSQVATNSAEVEEALSEKDKEIEALRAQLAAAQVTESLEDEDEDDDNDYSDVKGKDLVALAKERGIELTVNGTKLKAGEVRQALRDQDAAGA